jgi:hypothetical protein
MGEETQLAETSETVESVETVTKTVAEITPAVEVSAPTGDGEDLTKVRELVLKAHPDVVPDLIQGGTVDELIASVGPARSAYQRVADAIRGSVAAETVTAPAPEAPAVETPPAVPAGGAGYVIDPANIPATEKIARGLAEQKSRAGR